MSKLFWTTLIFLSGILTLHAQVTLLPSIGLTTLPSDSDAVCYIPMVNGGFNTNGIQVGDTASDFKLYNLAGDSVTLSGKLSSGKPVLMIAGSYTCPVFRNKVSSINNVVNLYGNQIEVLVIYTLEAHPDIDTSVYFGYVNTGAANISQGILYRQPTTYGERKDVVQDMVAAINMLAPVYIDGPCNNWWSHYGPAPNNAYLIDAQGVVFAKHGWYDKFPDNIICDIDSLLGNPTSCGGQGATGNFNFVLLSNDTITGAPGSTITFSGDLFNNSSADVIVDIYRLQNNMPFGWASSLCADVCYPTTTDTASILIPAGMVQHFYFYMYTDNTLDTARARVGFRNSNNPSNQYARNLIGITESLSSVADPVTEGTIKVYPNPATGLISIETTGLSEPLQQLTLTDLSGRTLLTSNLLNHFPGVPVREDISGYSPGTYLLQISSVSGSSYFTKIVIAR